LVSIASGCNPFVNAVNAVIAENAVN
jgi:hypothetical protein